MPRLASKIPSYRIHRPSGRAVVTLDGKTTYLGPFGSDESRVEYNRLIAEWVITRSRPADEAGRLDLTVIELLARYWRHAGDYYRDPDGGPSDELHNIRDAIRPLKRLYGHTPAAKFGPLALKAVRQALVDSGLCRSTINCRVSRIKRLFKWAASNELVPPSVFHGLCSVDGLRAGRGKAREPEPVRPVADEHVRAVLPFVTAPVRSMIELQRLTGMRPGEVWRMRTCDVDRSGPVWVYVPSRHKSQGKGCRRSIPIGPRGQAVLTPWLREDCPGAFVFSPAAAVAHRNAEKRRNRKTPVQPSQAARKRKANPKRPAGEVYDKNSYLTAIARACKKAGVPPWHPNQLRHSAATEIRARFGLEAAQVILGHSKANTTELYAERDLARAREVMREVG